MADTKLTVTFISGRKATVILADTTAEQVKAKIEAAKTAGEMVLVGGKLIAPEHIETVEARA